MDEDAVRPDAPERSRRTFSRRIALSAATTVAGAGLAVVLITNAYASTPAPAPDPTETAVQSYTSPGGYDLRAPKRAKFAAFAAVEAPGGDDGAAMPSGPVAPAGVAQAYAAKLVASHGWSDQDFACLVKLWNRESGWNAHAASGSGAYGIPQAFPGSKMASAGGDWRNDHRVQIRWGLGYIAGRYGTPCKAWANSVATGSY